MEIPGVGVINLEPPSETERPFIRKKFKAFFRSFQAFEDGQLSKQDFRKDALELSRALPEDETGMVVKKRMEVWDYVITFDPNRDSITEEEFIDNWLKRIYSDVGTRRKFLEHHKVMASIFFDQMDLNGNGFIDYEEFTKGFHVTQPEIVDMIFDAIDSNHDGVISRNELVYALAMHDWCSGPDSPFSLFFGPIIED